MEPGQRVEVIDGILRGERATITRNSDGGWRGGDDVWIKFDREEQSMELVPQWFDADRLRVI